MNCLTMAILVWFLGGFKGRIVVLKWGCPFPHFAVLEGFWAYHYKATNNDLPWYRQLNFEGEVVRDWVGPE